MNLTAGFTVLPINSSWLNRCVLIKLKWLQCISLLAETHTYTSVSDTDKHNWYVLLVSKNLAEHTLYTLADCNINTMPIVQRLSLNGGHLHISYLTKHAPLWYASHVSLSKQSLLYKSHSGILFPRLVICRRTGSDSAHRWGFNRSNAQRSKQGPVVARLIILIKIAM